jgi:hypothetical protein
MVTPLSVHHFTLVAGHQRWDGFYTDEEEGVTFVFHIIERFSTMWYLLL